MYDPFVIDVMDSLNWRWQCKPQGFILQNKVSFTTALIGLGSDLTVIYVGQQDNIITE